MDTLNLENPAITAAPTAQPSRVRAFWITALWGLFIAVAMAVGQLAIFVLALWQDGPFDILGGKVIPLSVIISLPFVLAASWLAVHFMRGSFTEYLALRGTSWKNFLIGAVGLAVVVLAWEMISLATGHESSSGSIMTGVFKAARDDGALWLLVLVLAVCVGAPVSEEVFARGFLYRGWSESFLRVPGAIVLSSLAWTALHGQYYNWFSFGEVFSMGLWFGYVRYRSGSIWATIVIHGLNNLAAVVQTYYMASQ